MCRVFYSDVLASLSKQHACMQQQHASSDTMGWPLLAVHVWCGIEWDTDLMVWRAGSLAGSLRDSGSLRKASNVGTHARARTNAHALTTPSVASR
eukprot:10904887-Alexandrium_andersonii.AAC.1